MPNSVYALILAGGSGERFWPLSRRARPKQLLRLVSEVTLLEETAARLEGFVSPDRIVVLTNVDQEAAVRALLTSLPHENIIAEPAKRDTAAAVALGVAWVAARDPRATMLVLPADHVIKNRDEFLQTLRVAGAAAETSDALVTIGVQPTSPHPGFGYIELSEAVDSSAGTVHRVRSFREKPSAEVAESFLRQGNFRWNAGMFVWTVPTILAQFDRHAPELARFISQAREPGEFASAVQAKFAGLPRISFDYAIMENADRVLAVEATFDWDDVGGWQAVARYLSKDGDGNASNCALTAADSTNNIVFAEDDASVALLGVRDLIVVRTADAVLVCHRDEAEKIKHLVARLPDTLQ